MMDQYDEADIKIKEVAEKIQETDLILDKVLKKAPEYTRVIFLGKTGAAKSTISNAIIGKKLRIAQLSKDSMPHLEAEDTPFSIGDNYRSTTSVPNIYVDEKHKFLICDAPGFEDNRGIKQDIVNSFAIDKLFQEPCNIKILLVSSEAEFSVRNGRGKAICDNLTLLTQMIPDLNNLLNNLGLIISNTPPKYNVAETLTNLLQRPKKAEINDCLNYFIENLDKCVFTFPGASYEHVGEEYVFKDLERLINYLYTTPLKDPKHEVILSTEAINFLDEITFQIGTDKDLVKELFDNIYQIYTMNGEDIDSLTKVSSAFIAIQKCLNTVQTPIEFANKVNDIVKNSNIEKALRKIRCYHSIYAFYGRLPNYSSSLLQYFSKNIRKTIEDEVNKVALLLHEKKLAKDLIEYQEMLAKMKLTIEQKQQEQIKLENEITRLANELKNNDKKNDTEIRELTYRLEQKITQLEALEKTQAPTEKAKTSFDWGKIATVLTQLGGAALMAFDMYNKYSNYKQSLTANENKKEENK